MTVKELKDKLNEFNDNLRINFRIAEVDKDFPIKDEKISPRMLIKCRLSSISKGRDSRNRNVFDDYIDVVDITLEK